LVLTSDRGLCGAFNTDINTTLGLKGRDYLRRRNAPIVHDLARIWDGLDIGKARLVARTVVPPLIRGEVDSIYSST
jgi:F-type H+-transporting ATPase subunit gamma